jgi:hypothetical protein
MREGGRQGFAARRRAMCAAVGAAVLVLASCGSEAPSAEEDWRTIEADYTPTTQVAREEEPPKAWDPDVDRLRAALQEVVDAQVSSYEARATASGPATELDPEAFPTEAGSRGALDLEREQAWVARLAATGPEVLVLGDDLWVSTTVIGGAARWMLVDSGPCPVLGDFEDEAVLSTEAPESWFRPDSPPTHKLVAGTLLDAMEGAERLEARPEDGGVERFRVDVDPAEIFGGPPAEAPEPLVEVTLDADGALGTMSVVYDVPWAATDFPPEQHEGALAATSSYVIDVQILDAPLELTPPADDELATELPDAHLPGHCTLVEPGVYGPSPDVAPSSSVPG